MKKIFIFMALCLFLSGCRKTALDLAVAVSRIDDPKISFVANGEEFSHKGDFATPFRIFKVEDLGFTISYQASSWDSANTLDDAVIGLNCGFISGNLKEDTKYYFSLEDELDTYPIFKYNKTLSETRPDGTVISSNQTFWFNAEQGSIEITKINQKKGELAGRFEFTAVSDDPNSKDTIEITDGVFKNIPYLVIED